MAIEVRRASRKKVRARIGLSAAAGGGKTMSALLIAHGLVGDWDKIGLIDTEAGSGELYVNHRVPGTTVTIGEFWYVRIDPPFTVLKYMEAQKALEDAGAEVIILDSITHAWNGQGGLLDQIGHITAASNSGNSYTAWRDVTPQHNRFIDGMLQSPAHIIATMRAKTDYVLETNKKGKQEPRKVGLAPIQREGMDYEFTVVLDLDSSHTAHASKDRTSLFDGEYFIPSPETGKRLLTWLNTGIDAPKPERPLTVREWLDALQSELRTIQGHDAVETVLARDDVCKALSAFRGGAADRLREMIGAAKQRAAEDAVWPNGEDAQWPGPPALARHDSPTEATEP
jgi:hypothetical protein